MPYKFIYFPVRGRGQALRYIFADNNIQYEEEIVPMDKWMQVKATTPLGQLPVLEDGDLHLGQSNAIVRHIARKHGLYGSNEIEMALIDMLNDQQEDLRTSYLGMIYKNYEAGKEPFIATLPDQLAIFEKYLAKNNGGNGFFVGNKISFVDYTIFDLLDNLHILKSICCDKFPLLKAFHQRIAHHEKIAAIRNTECFKKMPINGNGKQ